MKPFTDFMLKQEDTSLDDALRHFEIAEANLVKLERLWKELRGLIPSNFDFSINPNYTERCRMYKIVLEELPKIDGWKPSSSILGLDEISQNRVDSHELGEISAIVDTEKQIEAPGEELNEYRFKFNQKRKELINRSLADIVDEFDKHLTSLQKIQASSENEWIPGHSNEWKILESCINRIDTLLGSSVQRPNRWFDIQRHLRFGELNDFHDIVSMDWPQVKKALRTVTYEANDPIPIEIDDLGTVVKSKPKGRVTTELKWDQLNQETFERLIFELITTTEGYDNPQWLTQTNAPDKGRDLSVVRVIKDDLTGVTRQRVIVQCKHWQSKSIALSDITSLVGQMKLWEPPRVDTLIIASSGRFTTDAVDYVEKHNQADSALHIQMWPESHLEMILARKPYLIAEFGLK
jgi:hypothetical protein